MQPPPGNDYLLNTVRRGQLLSQLGAGGPMMATGTQGGSPPNIDVILDAINQIRGRPGAGPPGSLEIPEDPETGRGVVNPPQQGAPPTRRPMMPAIVNALMSSMMRPGFFTERLGLPQRVGGGMVPDRSYLPPGTQVGPQGQLAVQRVPMRAGGWTHQMVGAGPAWAGQQEAAAGFGRRSQDLAASRRRGGAQEF